MRDFIEYLLIIIDVLNRVIEPTLDLDLVAIAELTSYGHHYGIQAVVTHTHYVYHIVTFTKHVK